MGGADPAGTGGASLCSEFMLAVSCSQATPGTAAAGSGGAGGRSAGAGEGPQPAMVAVLGAERQWLRHAFNASSPEAGACAF